MSAMTFALVRRVLATVILAWGMLAVAQAGAIETDAREAYLVDMTTGTVLLDKNGDEPMPPASMSKLMTVYLLLSEIKAGRLSLEDKLPISEKAWRMGGSRMFLEVGKEVAVKDLLRGIIVQSGNDACVVAAEGVAGSEAAFAEQMNRKARELGLIGSSFANATGWPNPDQRMTARDLAVLAERLITDFPEFYELFQEREFTYNDITQQNRNPLLYREMGADGLKTGHTKEAGYGLTASVARDGRRLVLVINGLPSAQARREEAVKLIEWGFRQFPLVRMFAAGETVVEAPTWLGEQPVVPLVVPEDVAATVNRAARNRMVVKAVYDGPVPAPIEAGQPVGTLMVEVPGMAPKSYPLVAGADVEKLNLFGRLIAAFTHLVLGSAEPDGGPG